jgi:hypothetical protein
MLSTTRDVIILARLAHHDAAKQADATPTIGIGHNISIAHAQKGNGYQPEAVQDISIFLIMIPVQPTHKKVTTISGM